MFLRDTWRQQIDLETGGETSEVVNRGASIDKRVFFLNCPTLLFRYRARYTSITPSHESLSSGLFPSVSSFPRFDLFLLFLFSFSFLPSSLIQSTLRSVNPSYRSGTHRKLCSLLLRNIAEGNICVLISLAPQGYSRKLRRQAINHKSLTARKETRKGSFPPSRTSFFFFLSTEPLASKFSLTSLQFFPQFPLLSLCLFPFPPPLASSFPQRRRKLGDENKASSTRSLCIRVLSPFSLSPLRKLPSELGFNRYCPDVSVIKATPVVTPLVARNGERLLPPPIGRWISPNFVLYP